MQRLLTNSIQLNWLRTFEVVGSKLSFTLAATDLNMSQSAVSQQIQLLEHHLDQKLFVRANRSIRLTDAGRAFLPLVETAVNQLNLGAAQIFAPLNEATVDINVNTAFAVLWLAPRLQNFNAIYPQISIRQLSNNWSEDFEISTAEIEIRYGKGSWQGFECYQLVKPSLRPYCTPANAKQIRDHSDLSKMPLLDVVGTSQGWDAWLSKMNLNEISMQTRQYMDSYATSASMAASGTGICLMFDELLQKGIYSQELVAPFLESIDTESSYYLCYRSDKALSEASVLFKDWLLSGIEE
ncbi:MAG: LysR family transcriptional regulator [Cocleimonas sp.]